MTIDPRRVLGVAIYGAGLGLLLLSGWLTFASMPLALGAFVAGSLVGVLGILTIENSHQTRINP
jgi:hypothetical protein